jgi:general secretion pathway protein L
MDMPIIENEAIYKGPFPQEQRIVNRKAQFDQHLRQSTSAAQLGQLQGQIAVALPAETSIQVQQLDFSAATSQLVVRLLGSDASAWEATQAQLRKQGLHTNLKVDDAGAQLTLEQMQ